MANYKALLSVFSKDRVGLISLLTGHLFDRGIDLGDTSFARLGDGGEFSSVLDVPADIAEDTLSAELRSLDGLADAEIDIRRLNLANSETPPTDITHMIQCKGPDQPGLLARLSEVFIDFDANIVDLKSDQSTTPDGAIFVTRLAVNIPPDRAASCLAALGNTAESLGQHLIADAIGD
ncbi:MAG: amino acid-binding protein [Sneathiella sp.]|nr:MAG: amino acid-binding protein [Sneathiella sp.]